MIFAGNNPYSKRGTLRLFDGAKGGAANYYTSATNDWREILSQGDVEAHDLSNEFLGTATKSVMMTHELLNKNLVAVIANGDDIFAVSRNVDKNLVVEPMNAAQQETILPTFFQENYKQIANSSARRGLVMDPSKHTEEHHILETLNVVRNTFKNAAVPA